MTSYVENQRVEIEFQKELRKKLKRTFNHFFCRYGKFLEIQSEAIPVVLNGKNAIIVSATATGKTESVVAPLVERVFKEHIKEKSNELMVLYISPTRALVNDIYYRLKEPLEALGISITLRTGDNPRFSSEKSANFLVTTPESFDSLLCRYSQLFKNVKGVILDDIHFVDNTYRGDQLRILLRRLQQITTTNFNIYLLSATISNCTEVASRYMKEFEIIVAPGRRKIKYTLCSSLKEIFEYIKKENLRKILIFCNRRNQVELVSAEAQKLFGEKMVVVHHGSLSKTVRESAEKFMKESPYGVCVATMTLEIGIDIGDIDGVVLAEIPWSISSLLQRIGRGNRRTLENRVFAIYNSLDEKRILEEMFKIAIDGNLEPIDYSPSLSVIVQQIFSSLYQHSSGLNEHYFTEIFNGYCSKETFSKIIRHLTETEWVERKDGKWYATTKLMDMAERGQIHSNIPSSKTYKIIDVRTREVLGDIPFLVDEIFIFGGKKWKIVNVIKDKIYVEPAHGQHTLIKFRDNDDKGAFNKFLPPDMQSSR